MNLYCPYCGFRQGSILIDIEYQKRSDTLECHKCENKFEMIYPTAEHQVVLTVTK